MADWRPSPDDYSYEELRKMTLERDAKIAELKTHIQLLQILAQVQLGQSCHFELRMVNAECEVHRWKREARALRAIVQEDHPDELEVMRGLREWHSKNRRRAREAEARIRELEGGE
jgi:hypothetical protein